MNNKNLLISVALIFVLVSGIIYFTYSNNNGLYYAIEKKSDSIEDIDSIISSEGFLENTDSSIIQPETNATVDATNGESESVGATITVYLYGCVNQVDVYTLEAGTRVYDALKLAGGMTENAEIGYVNLARLLEDGESIFFPSCEEAKILVKVQQETEIIEASPLININTASKSELMNLPGIGEVKAASIISYRENTGKFSTIEDIMKVAGIKESLFLTVKDFIRVK